MNLVSIIGYSPNLKIPINTLYKIIEDVYRELDEHIEKIELSKDIPIFNGNTHMEVVEIGKKIEASDGVIFIVSNGYFAPAVQMMNLFEHFSMPIHRNILANKNCFVISYGNKYNKESMDYLKSVIEDLGGYTPVMIPVTPDDIRNIEESSLIIEKFAEDFYRWVKQKRRGLRLSNKMSIKSKKTENLYNIEETKQPKQPSEIKRADFEKISKAYMNNSNTFSKRDEEEAIDEISKALGSKRTDQSIYEKSPIFMEEKKESNPVFPHNIEETIFPNKKASIRQRTQGLVHYYQKYLADGLEAVYQFNIDGQDGFLGHIIINNGECVYIDGEHSSPDVTITCNCQVWSKVINGQVTSQRAFMTGQIKVRGNFVLLSKFDIIFKGGLNEF